MDPSYWYKKWQVGDVAFHQTQVNRNLLKYFPRVPIGKVFVPLCGKSSDMLWLAQLGYQVRGVELSPIACQAFFEENHFDYRTRKEQDFSVYEREPVEIWCGDYFQLPEDFLVGAVASYERASLIALPPAVRKKYVDFLKKLLQPVKKGSFQILLLTVQYPEGIEGPPFSISPEEIADLFGDAFEIELLQEGEDTQLKANLQKFENVPEITGRVHWLRW